MINETHSYLDTTLCFIKSSNVKAFPCGRRRSIYDGDSNPDTADPCYIPFDPEARLNTEANNRKHSGLNGYTQTYLKKWDESNKALSLVLAGYLFDVDLNSFDNINLFGSAIVDENTDATNTKIYANILIQDVKLFSGTFKEYYTGILRNQSDTSEPEQSLDLFKSSIETPDLSHTKDYNNYYFSGLSFSLKPITDNNNDTWSEIKNNNRQTLVSLCILEKQDGCWNIYQPAFLPKIEHGETKDSVVITELVASEATITDMSSTNVTITNTANINKANIDNLNAKQVITDDNKTGAEGSYDVPVIFLNAKEDNTYQLQITRANVWPKLEEPEEA